MSGMSKRLQSVRYGIHLVMPPAPRGTEYGVRLVKYKYTNTLPYPGCRVNGKEASFIARRRVVIGGRMRDHTQSGSI
jgi:hypothetical protein